MRGRGRLRYYPCRLSLVPALLATALPPDVVLVQTSVPSGGTVSLGTEVNVLPAAIEASRASDDRWSRRLGSAASVAAWTGERRPLAAKAR
jgi:hypothetical protein